MPGRKLLSGQPSARYVRLSNLCSGTNWYIILKSITW